MIEIDPFDEAPKPWWQSRAVVGSLISVAASAATLAGYRMDVSAATDLALSLAAIVGAALAWWGRVKAVRPISRTRVLPGIELNRP